MELLAEGTIRILLFANAWRQPEVCFDIGCADLSHADTALLQVIEKLPGMPAPKGDVLTVPTLLDQVNLKALNVCIAGRRRGPLPLGILQKAMDGSRVSATPVNQTMRRSAIPFPITPQALREERIEVLSGHTFERNLLSIEVGQELACMVQVQADRFAAELLALQPRFQGFKIRSHGRARAVDQTQQYANWGCVLAAPVDIAYR